MTVVETFAKRHPVSDLVGIVERDIYDPALHMVVGIVVERQVVIEERVAFTALLEDLATGRIDVSGHDRGSADVSGVPVVVERNDAFKVSVVRNCCPQGEQAAEIVDVHFAITVAVGVVHVCTVVDRPDQLAAETDCRFFLVPAAEADAGVYGLLR